MEGLDVWGQIAVETSQMYVSEGGVVKSRFANTVSFSQKFYIFFSHLMQSCPSVRYRPSL